MLCLSHEESCCVVPKHLAGSLRNQVQQANRKELASLLRKHKVELRAISNVWCELIDCSSQAIFLLPASQAEYSFVVRHIRRWATKETLPEFLGLLSTTLKKVSSAGSILQEILFLIPLASTAKEMVRVFPEFLNSIQELPKLENDLHEGRLSPANLGISKVPLTDLETAVKLMGAGFQYEEVVAKAGNYSSKNLFLDLGMYRQAGAANLAEALPTKYREDSKLITQLLVRFHKDYSYDEDDSWGFAEAWYSSDSSLELLSHWVGPQIADNEELWLSYLHKNPLVYEVMSERLRIKHKDAAIQYLSVANSNLSDFQMQGPLSRVPACVYQDSRAYQAISDMGLTPLHVQEEATVVKVDPRKISQHGETDTKVASKWMALPEASAFSFMQKMALKGLVCKGILAGSLKVDPSKVEASERTEVLGKAQAVKGWYDVSRYLSNDESWVVWLLLKEGKEPTDISVATGIKGKRWPEKLSKHVSPWKNLQAKTYESLCAEYGVAPYGNAIDMQLPLARIAQLFKQDLDGAKRFILSQKGKKSLKKAAHDAGQFQLPAKFAKGWSGFFLKYPKAISHARFIERIEHSLGQVPATLREFNKAVALCAYTEVPAGYESFAAHCFEMGVDEETFDETLGYKGNAKKKAMLPDLRIRQGEHALSLLPIGDLRALLIGEESGCCQSLNGAGEDAAIHSFEKPDSGVYLMESDNGTLKAQTWAWLSKDKKSIVLDSIESRFSDKETIATVAKLVSALVEDLNEKGIKVFIATTGYGMTQDVTRRLGGLGHKFLELETPEPYSYLDYSDAGSESNLIKPL